MENVRVREAYVRDAPQLWAMARRSFAEEMALWGVDTAQALASFCLFAFLRAWQKLRKAPFFQLHVAEAGGKAVAGAAVVWRKGYAYLQLVMVHPDFRRRGLGRRIVTQAVEEAFRAGANKVVLHVRTDNVPARRLYESLGFQPFEERLFLVAETKLVPKPKGWPAGFRLIRANPWDRRISEIAETARGPEARTVYGPLPPPRRNPVVREWFRPTWLLLGASGQAVASLSLTRSRPARLDLCILPELRGVGLENALLAWGMSRVRGGRIIMCTDGGDAPLVQAALEVGFQEKMRDIGMVLGKGD